MTGDSVSSYSPSKYIEHDDDGENLQERKNFTFKSAVSE